jgi:hypothetical protein
MRPSSNSPDRCRAARAKDQRKRVERGLREFAEDVECDVFEIALEARRRQIRDGNFEPDWDFEWDGPQIVGYLFPRSGGPEEAVEAAGYDPSDPDIQEVIQRACEFAADLASEAAVALDGEGCREEAIALGQMNAPDHPLPHEVGRPALPATRLIPRPKVRRGRARRPSCNGRARGSRRGTSARAGPGDKSDPDEPPGGRLPRVALGRGPLCRALVGVRR